MGDIAIIVGAGKGTRMGGVDKAFAPLLDVPMIVYSARIFQGIASIDEIVLVVRRESQDRAREVIDEYKLSKARVVAGGDKRHLSVYNAMETIQQGGVVAVHDAARPLVSAALVENLLYEARLVEALVFPYLQPVDALYRVDHGGAKVVRKQLYALAQTPQVARFSIMKVLYDRPNSAHEFSDEGELAEFMEKKMVFIPGEPRNFKVTFPDDVVLAEALLRCSQGSSK